MRSGRSFLVLLVLAAGLGSYAYFIESKNDTSREKLTTREKVFTLESEKIDELTVKAVNGDVTKVKKESNTWKIVSPAAHLMPIELAALRLQVAADPAVRQEIGSDMEAKIAVFRWLEGWYNLHRRHSSLGYLSPINYERKLLTTETAEI